MMHLLNSIPLDAILSPITVSEEERLLAQKGYTILEEICATLQGTLSKARRLTELPNGYRMTQFCAIKRVSKLLHRQRITNMDGSSFCVAEDIEKEGAILRKWADSTFNPVQEFLVRYIDYFESTESIYLVTGLVHCTLSLSSYIHSIIPLLTYNDIDWLAM